MVERWLAAHSTATVRRGRIQEPACEAAMLRVRRSTQGRRNRRQYSSFAARTGSGGSAEPGTAPDDASVVSATAPAFSAPVSNDPTPSSSYQRPAIRTFAIAHGALLADGSLKKRAPNNASDAAGSIHDRVALGDLHQVVFDLMHHFPEDLHILFLGGSRRVTPKSCRSVRAAFHRPTVCLHPAN